MILKIIQGLTLVGLGLSTLGPALAHFRQLTPYVGFRATLAGGAACGLALAAGTFLILKGPRSRGLLITTGVAAMVTLPLLALALRKSDAPLINDISTDLQSPPELTSTAARSDLPENLLIYDPALREIQTRSYPDLKGLNLPIDPASAFSRTLTVARSNPNWTLHEIDEKGMRIEGQEETFLFRFRDHFVIQVRATDSGSIVHMRSRSRDGKGDLGANTRRIRQFLGSLKTGQE